MYVGILFLVKWFELTREHLILIIVSGFFKEKLIILYHLKSVSSTYTKINDVFQKWK